MASVAPIDVKSKQFCIPFLLDFFRMWVRKGLAAGSLQTLGRTARNESTFSGRTVAVPGSSLSYGTRESKRTLPNATYFSQRREMLRNDVGRTSGLRGSSRTRSSRNGTGGRGRPPQAWRPAPRLMRVFGCGKSMRHWGRVAALKGPMRIVGFRLCGVPLETRRRRGRPPTWFWLCNPHVKFELMRYVFGLLASA